MKTSCILVCWTIMKNPYFSRMLLTTIIYKNFGTHPFIWFLFHYWRQLVFEIRAFTFDQFLFYNTIQHPFKTALTDNGVAASSLSWLISRILFAGLLSRIEYLNLLIGFWGNLIREPLKTIASDDTANIESWKDRLMHGALDTPGGEEYLYICNI